MPKNFKIAEKVDWKRLRFKDPRILMRALIGTLLLANLVVAVIAFKPFGGSADDLRREQETLSVHLRTLNARLEESKRLVNKVEIARSQGDDFYSKYIMDARSVSQVMFSEMTKAAADAGIKPLPQSSKFEEVEGNDSLQQISYTQGFEGTYASLTKLVNFIEKSQRFLILDTMALNATQQNAQGNGPQVLTVTLTVITFSRNQEGPAL